MDALESVEHNLHLAIENEQDVIGDIRRVMGNKDDADLIRRKCEQQLADKQAYRDRIRDTVADAESDLADAKAEHERVSDMCSRFENDLKNIRSEIEQTNRLLNDIIDTKESEMGLLGKLDDDLGKLTVEDKKKIEHDEQQVIDRIKQLRSDLEQIEARRGNSGEKELSIEKQERLIKQRLETLDKKLSKMDSVKGARDDANRSLKAMRTASGLIEEDTVPRDVQSRIDEAESNLKSAKADRNEIKSEIRRISNKLLFARGEKRRNPKKDLETKKTDLKKVEVAVEKAKSELNAAKIDKRREPSRVRAANKELARIKEKERKLEENLSEKEKQIEIAEREVESANRAFNEARAELGEIRWAVTNSRNLDAERQKMLNDLEMGEKNLEKIRTRKSRTEISNELNSSRKNVEARLNGIEGEENELKTKLSYLKSEKDSILPDLEEMRRELAEQEKKVMENENFLMKERSDLKKAEESVKLVEDGLKSAIEEVTTVDDEISQAISRILAKKSELATTTDEFERTVMQELKVAQNVTEELEQLTRELEESKQREIESLRTELTQTSGEELEQLRRELEESQNTIRELEESRHQELDSVRSELETAQNAAKELEESKQREIESMRAELAQTSGEEVERLTRELEAAQNEIIEVKSRQDPLLSELETTRKNLGDVTMEIAQLKEMQENLGTETPAQKAVEDQDTKKLLTILDEMLEHLPPDLIDKFANSDDYVLYEKVLDGYGI